MNLKLNQSELQLLLNAIQPQHFLQLKFNTQFELKLSLRILREFFLKWFMKAMSDKQQFTLKIDEKTLLVLNHVLPQIYPDNEYDVAVMTRIITQINQACLSI